MRIFMKSFIATICILLSVIPSYSQGIYDVANIPAELKVNAKAIVRTDETVVEVTSANKLKIKSKFVITILNENGLDVSFFRQYYDKFSKISGINGIVYDAKGKKIRRVPNDEINDYSAISGYSAYDDNRKKVIDPKITTFPSTVEYTWEETIDNLFNIPGWYAYPDYNVSVEFSSYKLILPNEKDIRYYDRNLSSPPIITTSEGVKNMMWQEKGLPALKPEYFCAPFAEYTPNIIFSSSEFELAKTTGNAASWQEIGQWAWGLNKGRDSIPAATRQKILNLINGAKSDVEKVQIIYDYLQNNTRYVNISVGIGGFQPFEAEVVDRLAYGDCKALSNYMYSLLKIAGVKSHYTLVNAGDNNLIVTPEFPSIRFNHVFLCVPLENDTLWLECTSQTVPCGYLGSFTDDRDVLVIKEDGGHLVHTKVYTAEENTKSTKAIVNLYADGRGQVFISRKYQGQFYDEIEPVLRSDDADKKKLIYKYNEIPDFKLNSFKYNVEKSRIPVVYEDLDLYLGNYATLMGNNMFLPLNLLNKYSSLPKRAEDRKSDIYIPRAFTEIDTVIYNLPEGYIWSGTPEQKEISSDYGNYSYEIKSGTNQVIYIRKIVLNKGRFPKTDYPKLFEFFESISVSDAKKIALKKT
jgi:hypothetical protein